MYIPSSKNFAKFFLAFSHCFLLLEPPFPLVLAWSLFISMALPRSLALWLCGPVLALCLHLSVCLWVPGYLLDLPFWFWFPGPSGKSKVALVHLIAAYSYLRQILSRFKYKSI